MARNFEVKCPNCGTLVAVIERPMGVPGGKEREEAGGGCGQEEEKGSGQRVLQQPCGTARSAFHEVRRDAPRQ